MRANIIKIGNSRGIRLPKALLEETGIDGEVEITARKGAILIRAFDRPRSGWDAAFKDMASREDDLAQDTAQLLDHSFDREEWEWT